MFALTALAYPCVLALLCAGAGLLIDRMSGSWLPGMLLAVVGAAALIAVSQLTTYVAFAAPATPYVLVAVAVAGFTLGWQRLSGFAREWRLYGWQIVVGVLAYVIALAPILFAGRPSFSGYQALTDSAVHMLGADYLMRHGQDYARLDLLRSYGQYIHDYYGTSYPSGADTLFGGSSFILGLPLIWAFQPFNAVMLTLAAGPAWVLARRIGLAGGWAALAALTATVPALVYGYELVASVKEIVALSMILALGALVVLHPRWLWRESAEKTGSSGSGDTGSGVFALGVLPAAIVLAAGLSALGVGFGTWGLAAVAVLGTIAVRDVAAGRHSLRELLAVVAVAALTTIVCALSTWADLAGSLHVATNIAATTNPGNLQGALHPIQALGTWLVDHYEQTPSGGLLALSYAIAILTLAAAGLGAVRILYMGEYALAGWIALIVVAGIVLTTSTTAWVNAKTFMLSSPVLVLLAWGGIAGLRVWARRSRYRWALPLAIVLPALVLAGGIGVSDALQYHASNLAPTARYDELESIDRRFAGRGPTLVTDFDEYTLYELRDMDIGGLDFMYPPVGLRAMKGHGYPVDLDHVSPAALVAYPLIVTRRDPTVSEPPSAYRLVWQGAYYQVWARRPGAPAAIDHLGLSSTRPVQCSSVRSLALLAAAHGGQLVAAVPPETVMAGVADSRHTSDWTYTHPGLEMTGAGHMTTTFTLPYAGVWEIWLKGQFMPEFSVSVDGHAIASLGGEIDGNPHNPDTTAPLPVGLSAGVHRLTIARGGVNLNPGDGGWAIVHEIFLTPADAPDIDTLHVVPLAEWRSLCGGRFDWIEVVPG
jgi:hypothetical protein